MLVYIEILRKININLQSHYINVVFNVNLRSTEGEIMHEYVFKMKKGDIEIELKSDDIEFVEEQLNKWRDELLKTNQQNG